MNRPPTPFLAIAFLLLVVLFFEYSFLRQQVELLLTSAGENQAKQAELEKRSGEIADLKSNLPVYEEAFEELLGGYTDAPLQATRFGALYALAPAIVPKDQSKRNAERAESKAAGKDKEITPTWTYEFSSNEVEFHKFVPALAELENGLPLVRFSKLILSCPQEPFFEEATALNIAGTITTIREGARLAPVPRK